MDTAALPLYRLKRSSLLAVTVLLLIGIILRAGMLARDVRFHPDEALYATFARRVSLQGDIFLSNAPLDKPPLAIALTAIAFSIFGISEFSARLPTVLVSLLTLAVFYALIYRLYRDILLALLGLALFAISPFDLAFAATAFLDPLLTFCLLMACLFATYKRWVLAGTAFICAIATKQSALFFLPLILALGVAANLPISWRTIFTNLCRFVIPVVIGGLIIALWSAARAAPVDFWTLGSINNNPGRFIRANEIIPRLQRWIELLSYIVGFAPLLIIGFLPLIKKSQHKLIDLILTTFSLILLLSYWLVAFNTYDRYLHTLNPVLLMLVARGLRYSSGWIKIIVLTSMIVFSYKALGGNLMIGGDPGKHTGIDQIAAVINTLPAGTVIHNYSLDWELGFYLGGVTSARSVFQPSPESLMRHVCPEGGYFAAFAEEAPAWLTPLDFRGVKAILLVDGQIQLYRLECSF